MPINKIDKKKNGLQVYRVRVNFTDAYGKARQIERTAYGLAEANALEQSLIAEYKESRAQKKYMNKKMPTCTEDGITKYTCKKCGDTYTEVFATNSETLPEYSGRVDF